MKTRLVLAPQTGQVEENQRKVKAIFLHSIARSGRKGKVFMHYNGTTRIFTRMSKAKRRSFIVKLIEDAIFAYLLFAFGWTICWLLNEIFTKLGVA